MHKLKSQESQVEFTAHYSPDNDKGVTFDYTPLEGDTVIGKDEFPTELPLATDIPSRYSFDNPLYDSVEEEKRAEGNNN